MTGSDMDMMHSLSNMKVVTNNNLQIFTYDSSSHFVLPRSDGIHPGFAMMELVRLGQQSEDGADIWPGSATVLSWTENTALGERYISNEKFRSFFLEGYNSIDLSSLSNRAHSRSADYLHGPCVTSRRLAGVEADVAYCLSCTLWPPQAEEWVHRYRESEFPSVSLVETLIKRPCFFVPVASKLSPVPHLEWRLSFSMQEKEIIFNINPAQRKVYGLLKLLMKEVFSVRIPDVLCSYIMKTVIFWLSEEIPLSCWKDKNLLFCLMACLQRITEWLHAGHCPNYFVRANNMFDGKRIEELMSSAEYILQIMSEGWVLIFHCKTLVEYRDRFSDSCLPIAEQEMSYDTVTEERECDFKGFGKWYGMLVSMRYMARIDLKLFNLFQSRLNDHAIDVAFDLELVEYLKQYIDEALQSLSIDLSDLDSGLIELITLQLLGHIGELCFAHSYLDGLSNRNRYPLMKSAQHYLEIATKKDISDGNLKLATFHYENGTYHMALSFINKFLSEYGPYAVYCHIPQFRHTGIMYNYESDSYYEQKCCSKGLTLAEKAQKALVTDVHFDKFEYCYAPLPVQLELTILNMYPWIVFINPLVYAYYLNFCCYTEMKRPEESHRSLAMLMELVHNDHRVSKDQTHQVYNFSAHCHMMLGDHVMAGTMLQESLEIKPDFNPAALMIPLL